MKATVNQKECVGCGLCADTCPAVFEMDGNVAKVVASPVPKDQEQDCRRAAEDCPVTAITIEP